MREKFEKMLFYLTFLAILMIGVGLIFIIDLIVRHF